MFHECGLPPARIHRGYRMLARMRTEVIAGQHLDMVSSVSGVCRWKVLKQRHERHERHVLFDIKHLSASN